MKDCKSCSCVDLGTCVECLKGQLEQHKEALRLATNDAEKEIGCPPAENRACCKWQGDHSPCIDCITNYYLTKAKGEGCYDY